MYCNALTVKGVHNLGIFSMYIGLILPDDSQNGQNMLQSTNEGISVLRVEFAVTINTNIHFCETRHLHFSQNVFEQA
jgi:hypothetical protein